MKILLIYVKVFLRQNIVFKNNAWFGMFGAGQCGQVLGCVRQPGGTRQRESTLFEVYNYSNITTIDFFLK